MELVAKDMELDEAELCSALDRISKTLIGRPAAIEIAATTARSLTLLSVSFDLCGDIHVIAMDGFNHKIRSAREVYRDQLDGMLVGIEVVDAAGVRHVVKLTDPAALTAAPGA